MNIKQLFLLFVGFSLFITACKKGILNNDNKADTVKIISASITPGLIYGQFNTITVTVHYSLTTSETATLMLGFNNGENPELPISTSANNIIIKKGNGQYVYTVLAIAKDWGSQADFYAYADMAANPLPNNVWQSWASDTYILIKKH